MIVLRVAAGYMLLVQKRNRRFFVFLAFLGLVLPLILQASFGQQLDAEGRTRLLLGNVTFGALMLVMRKASSYVGADRISGTGALLRTTLLTRSVYLGSLAADALLTSLLPLGVALLGCAMSGIAGPQSMAWLVPYGLFIAAIFWIGAFCAQLGQSPAVARTTVNLVAIASIVFCPVYYPVDRAPSFVQALVSFSPAGAGTEAMAAGWEGESLPLLEMATLAVWAAVFAFATVRRLSWGDAD
jgi:ABC-type polysaccharide/polyol phosphate export permease